jgi:hypothetical protein
MIRRQFKATLVGGLDKSALCQDRAHALPANSSYSITASAVGSSDGGMVRNHPALTLPITADRFGNII